MRKAIFCAMMILGLCCFAASRASAQETYEYSVISYDDSTDTVYGYSATEIDYTCSGDYQAYVEGYLYGQYGVVDSGYDVHPYLAQVYTSTSADPDVDYTVESYHDVIARYYDDQIQKSPDGCMPCDGCNTDCYYYQEDYYWWDPYGFSSSGHTGNYGSWVSFFGNGPYVEVEDDEYIDLGETTDSLQTPRVPNHLKVGNDLFGSTGCGGAWRELDYVVVDNHTPPRPVGSISIIEDPDGGKTDSCSNKQVVFTTSCSAMVNSAGIFSDILQTGCPAIGGSCGYDVPNDKWKWCKGTSTQPTLGTINYSVHYDQIKVNGSSTSLEGTEIFP